MNYVSFFLYYKLKMHDNLSMIVRIVRLSESNSFFLFGPRACGKSTLLKSHFRKLLTDKKALWIDLLSPETGYKLSQKPERMLDMWRVHQPPWIVIDEIQRIPSLLDVAHQMIEEKEVCFALSGSSARKLRRGHANLLGGRATALYLAPFSFIEIEQRFDLSRALKFGLLPRFWTDNKMSDEEIIRSLYAYVDVYLKEEVAAEQLVRHLDPFKRFLESAAQSNGTVINFSKIERDAGLGASQAQKHFDILSDTLIGFFLAPFHTSIRKRQSRKSKFYFFDTGVLRALRMMAGESLHPSTFEYGNLFETFLINEVLKTASALEKRWKFSYLQTQGGVEIDLVIEKPQTAPLLIEIKSAETVKKEHLRALKTLSDEFPDSEKRLWHRGKDSFVTDGIKCMPWYEGIKELFLTPSSSAPYTG